MTQPSDKPNEHKEYWVHEGTKFIELTHYTALLEKCASQEQEIDRQKQVIQKLIKDSCDGYC